MKKLTELLLRVAEAFGLSKNKKKTVRIGIFDEYNKEIKMPLQIEDMQKVKLTARGVSAAGNPTTDLQGPLAWTTSDGSIVSITPQAFPQCYADAVGPLGASHITAVGRNGAGQTVSGAIDIEVKAGPTATVLIEAAAPEPR